ncbi:MULTISPECIES: alkaline phosphatase family protein [unclassified Paenibacillus]|uniref:alkaline phosphatase family protein n=1 Tax=unclassified Paenibacillus TaxID=185978 RepID=UPI000956AF8C|nr:MULTISPECIES: alkaline phosphatase family protein [unclassified Paenibacillus]QID16032.1 hypothetical protein CIC07_25200 [Paenibacillus sp. RUD330]SIR40097.1 Type I phosphodiesterase / nucleotide pyrophosphatase [Paenibacillus sp. RU4X]SIR50351.1 Type I phosphodiesterase / nucleotide pyrophosphatase [Paenibacillus sp. RU4T]
MNKRLKQAGAAALIASALLPSVPAEAAGAPPDAVLQLKFDGSAADSSGNNVSVAVAGSPSYTAGRIGQALEFSSAGQYVDLGRSASTTFGSATDYSVSFWLQASGSVTGDPVIIGNKNWSTGANAGWVIALQANGSIKWNYTPAGQSRSDAYIPGAADGQWHLVTVTHDRDGSARLYKDGTIAASADIASKTGSIDTAYSTRIAQDATGSYGSVLRAKLDELQLFKRSLSAEEVLALYNAAPPVQGGSSRKVLVIGIDGARPDAVQAADAPNLHSLAAAGAYSWNAQANGSNTWSATGWSTMHTGVWYGKHGVKDNSWTGSQFGAYPSLMKRAEQAKPALNTSSIVHWSPINTNLVDGIDQEISVSTDAEVAAAAIGQIKNGSPDLMFLQFDDVDHAGHTYGFSPSVPQYGDAIHAVDGQIGSILDAVKNRSTYSGEQWLILVSTDHGGKGTSHGGSSAEERTIFYLASGPGTTKGPIAGTVNQTDVMATALSYLGIPLQSAWNLDGKPAGLAG